MTSQPSAGGDSLGATGNKGRHGHGESESEKCLSQRWLGDGFAFGFRKLFFARAHVKHQNLPSASDDDVDGAKAKQVRSNSEPYMYELVLEVTASTGIKGSNNTAGSYFSPYTSCASFRSPSHFERHAKKCEGVLAQTTNRSGGGDRRWSHHHRRCLRPPRWKAQVKG